MMPQYSRDKSERSSRLLGIEIQDGLAAHFCWQPHILMFFYIFLAVYFWGFLFRLKPQKWWVPIIKLIRVWVQIRRFWNSNVGFVFQLQKRPLGLKFSHSQSQECCGPVTNQKTPHGVHTILNLHSNQSTVVMCVLEFKKKKHNKGCKLLILHWSAQIIETSVWPTATGTQSSMQEP